MPDVGRRRPAHGHDGRPTVTAFYAFGHPVVMSASDYGSLLSDDGNPVKPIFDVLSGSVRRVLETISRHVVGIEIQVQSASEFIMFRALDRPTLVYRLEFKDV